MGGPQCIVDGRQWQSAGVYSCCVALDRQPIPSRSVPQCPQTPSSRQGRRALHRILLAIMITITLIEQHQSDVHVATNLVIVMTLQAEEAHVYVPVTMSSANLVNHMALRRTGWSQCHSACLLPSPRPPRPPLHHRLRRRIPRHYHPLVMRQPRRNGVRLTLSLLQETWSFRYLFRFLSRR